MYPPPFFSPHEVADLILIFSAAHDVSLLPGFFYSAVSLLVLVFFLVSSVARSESSFFLCGFVSYFSQPLFLFFVVFLLSLIPPLVRSFLCLGQGWFLAFLFCPVSMHLQDSTDFAFPLSRLFRSFLCSCSCSLCPSDYLLYGLFAFPIFLQVSLWTSSFSLLAFFPSLCPFCFCVLLLSFLSIFHSFNYPAPSPCFAATFPPIPAPCRPTFTPLYPLRIHL